MTDKTAARLHAAVTAYINECKVGKRPRVPSDIWPAFGAVQGWCAGDADEAKRGAARVRGDRPRKYSGRRTPW